MKGQEHNQGKLTEVTIKIEEQLATDLATMSKNSGLDQSELLAIALKRFRASHMDYMGKKLDD